MHRSDENLFKVSYSREGMTFENNKKTFLAKLDKSKKGSVDQKILPLLQVINQKDAYYTTSSCSGRVYLWRGSGKKNQTEWLKVSHDPMRADFFILNELEGLIWLRLEPVILHICCRDSAAAEKLLQEAKKIYKKSCLLSISNKMIVEIRGSEFMEMPFYDGKLLYAGDMAQLQAIINQKLEQIWTGTEKLKKIIESF